MAATTAQPMGSLPSGMEICTTAPDVLYLPELVSGQRQVDKGAEVISEGSLCISAIQLLL